MPGCKKSHTLRNWQTETVLVLIDMVRTRAQRQMDAAPAQRAAIIPAPKHSCVPIRGGAFPLITIDLDASAGPLSFLDYADRARTEAVSRQFLAETRAPPLWEAFVTGKKPWMIEEQPTIFYRPRVDDTLFIRAFLRKSPRLSLLKRLEASGLTDASFITIGACCPALTSLKVGDISEAGLRAIAVGCPAMERLAIVSNEGQLTDDALVYAVERFPKLSVFKVQPDIPEDSHFILTDATVLAIATHCPLLTTFDSWTANLTDNSITALVRSCPLLESLDLHTCCLKSNDDDADEGITDASMMAIAEHCSALRKLDLSFCQGMSDAGMIAVAQGCPLLESLELDDCEWITEEAVDIIRETCPRLARLSTSY